MDAVLFPVTMSVQPRPSVTKVCYLEIGRVIVTSITRHFEEDDARRCRLCPAGQCSYFAGSCTVMVDQLVPPEDAKMYNLNDTNFVLLAPVVRDDKAC